MRKIDFEVQYLKNGRRGKFKSAEDAVKAFPNILVNSEKHD